MTSHLYTSLLKAFSSAGQGLWLRYLARRYAALSGSTSKVCIALAVPQTRDARQQGCAAARCVPDKPAIWSIQDWEGILMVPIHGTAEIVGTFGRIQREVRKLPAVSLPPSITPSHHKR